MAEKGTAWTSQQVKIFELLQQKKSLGEVSKLLGCSKPTAQKVKNAMLKGETPADKKPPKAKPLAPLKQTHVIPKTSNPIDVAKTVNQYKNQAAPDSEPEEEQPPTEDPESPLSESGEDTPDNQQPETSKPETGNKPTTGKPPKSAPPPEGITTVMKMVSVPVNVAITPVMQNARILATVEWGWRGDMPWEDFFDTCLFILCRSCGYEIKGYYKVDKDGNPVDTQNKPSEASAPKSTDGKGDGTDYDEADMKLGVEIAKYLKQVKQKEVSHAS